MWVWDWDWGWMGMSMEAMEIPFLVTATDVPVC